ncbi:hypothetical protein SPRG_06366 [Saprolegnia parasitica CBS 223.65]|uniref:EF-hand domain-containing protein n=1 Tax=Saprolegnia parasitica (strain CBS 223.65) TaxID=695850 RepID=A0A067CP64_SAPPC|nr:hypothetical protein SPRG_06366 [Saprolegnia parasitica CBS 223.65]KDO28316.1 hypothetical protein SPRG_06366 [Saprolegnia parasitica CBS 223.65]|eukprot:XP_012201135.1 hypothetical protein SPRG_06366 [Saprolegnia parasitica CBS 223.65]
MDETAPLLPRRVESDEDVLFSAAWLVEDALLGYTRPRPLQTHLAYQLYEWHAHCAILSDVAIYVLIALAFVEVPHWCNHDPATLFACGDPSSPETPMTFNAGFLTLAQSRSVALACLLFLLADVLFGYTYLGAAFLGRHERKVQLGLVVVSLVDVMGALAWPAYADTVASLRLHEYARIVMFVFSQHELRRALRKILRVVAEVRNILSLVVVFILSLRTPEGVAQMPNIYEACWHFMILLTTANFPDIMMPAYNSNRSVVLFFIFFLCFGLFFLLNVVLAVVFNNFARFSDAELALSDRIRTEKLAHAFECLQSLSNHPETVPMDVCLRLFQGLHRFRNISHLERDEMTALFDALDANGDHVLDLAEFLHVCEAVERVLIKEPQPASEVEVYCPRLFTSVAFQKLRAAVRHPTLEVTIDVVLVANAIVVFVESFSILNDAEAKVLLDTSAWTIWDALELGFTLIYLVEMLAKMLVYGLRGYWISIKNRFDCVITLAVVAADAYAYLPGTSLQVVKILLIARCLRLFRLIINIKGYRVICTTWLRLLHFGQHLLLLTFCAMYVYALLGNQLFGGRISPGRMRREFPESAYTQADYMANNFNDMPSAIVLLFELLLVNNWFVLADGHAAVSSKYARWYFIAYYVTGVTLLLNLVVASILDSFMDEYKHEHGQDAAVAGACLIQPSPPPPATKTAVDRRI